MTMGLFQRDSEEIAKILISDGMKADMEDFTRDLASTLPDSSKYVARVDLFNKRWRGYIISTLPNALNYEAKYGELSALLKKRNI